MTNIGIICPPVPSHINSATAIGRELKKRGHRIILLGIPDIEAKVRSEEIEFYPIGQSDHPLGSLNKSLSELGKLNGLSALRFIIMAAKKTTQMICRDAPQAIKSLRIQALIVDQTEPAGGTVADHLDIPFITFCSALPTNQVSTIPPFFTDWDYQTTWKSRVRNKLGYSLFNWLSRPIIKTLNKKRAEWMLPLYRTLNDSYSQLAQISQLTENFDFPFDEKPNFFHYTGPFRLLSSDTVSFPYEKLTGQPLVYASLGTLHNLKQEIFRCIAHACENIDVQLIISLGGGGDDMKNYQDFPGRPLIVKFAPQQELLTRVKLVITHAGLNTVLESLSQGVPMVALPITGDQPGVASRVSWSGTGETLDVKRLTSSRLEKTIQKVLTDDSYFKNAQKIKKSIQTLNGAVESANIIEQVIKTRQPALFKKTK